jgi:hypothetical protein
MLRIELISCEGLDKLLRALLSELAAAPIFPAAMLLTNPVAEEAMLLTVDDIPALRLSNTPIWTP